MKNIFKEKQFDIGLYYRFSLSYRDVSEILEYQGIKVNPITSMPWAHQYGKLIHVILKKKNKSNRISP